VSAKLCWQQQEVQTDGEKCLGFQFSPRPMRDKNRAMKRMWKQWDYCLNLCELYELVHPPGPIYISHSHCRQSFSCNCRHVSTLNGYKTANKTGKSKATCPHQRRTFLIYGHLSVGCGGVQCATVKRHCPLNLCVSVCRGYIYMGIAIPIFSAFSPEKWPRPLAPIHLLFAPVTWLHNLSWH